MFITILGICVILVVFEKTDIIKRLVDEVFIEIPKEIMHFFKKNLTYYFYYEK